MKKNKELKIWNGRSYDLDGTLYVAAYSKADACRMLNEVYSGRSVPSWRTEMDTFFADCWGISMSMDKVKIERGIWKEENSHKFNSHGPVRIYPLDKKGEKVPSQEILLKIKMVEDLGFHAYWNGESGDFKETPSWAYDLVEKLIEAGWKKGE